jgi:NADH-quinone oxidoreductase subunit L
LLTSFYSWRLIFLTFFGKPRWAASEHIQHALHDAHHGHGTTTIPRPSMPATTPPARSGGADVRKAPAATIRTKARGRCWCRWACCRSARSSPAWSSTTLHRLSGGRFWGGSLYFDTHLMHEIHDVPLWVKLAPAIVMIIGFLIALQAYIRNTGFPAASSAQFGVLHRFLYNKWFFDELYNTSSSAPRCGSAASSGSAAMRRRSTASAQRRRGAGRAATCSPRGCSPAISTPTRW